MADIYKTPEKRDRKEKLLNEAQKALIEDGWKISPIPKKSGLKRIYRIERGKESRVVCIRTTQDLWFAFVPTEERGWRTLDEVDSVVVATLNDKENPTKISVYMFDAKDVRRRFTKARKARESMGRKYNCDRGLWVALYNPEDVHSVYAVGAGIAVGVDPLREVPLEGGGNDNPDTPQSPSAMPSDIENGLTIPQAKAGLAKSFGVSVDKIRISVEA